MKSDRTKQGTERSQLTKIQHFKLAKDKSKLVNGDRNFMKNDLPMDDDLRPEYDLKNLRVRGFGSERKSVAGHTVRLEPDVAEIFPDAESVNEALHFLIRIMQQNQESIPNTTPE